VEDAVEAIDVLAHPTGQGGQVVGARDVELDDGCLLRQSGRAPGGQAHDPAEGGEHDRRTLLLRQSGDMERDGLVREDTGDEDALAVEQAHVRVPS